MFMQTKVSLLAASLLLAAILGGCNAKKQDKAAQQAIRVKAITLQESSFTSEKSFVGVIEEETASALSFSVQGNVEKILVNEGQLVSKGQLLAELNTDNLQSSYDAAKATLKQAQDANARLQQLYNNNSLPEIKYVEAQTKLEQAQSMASIAGKNLRNSRLTAPFSGVIGRRSIQVGENAIPGNTAFTLLNISSVKVKVAIPEDEIASIILGQNALVSVPAASSLSANGQVVEKGIVAHPMSHTYDIKIRLQNAERKLMPGMVCKVWFNQGKSTSIVLPNTAIQSTPEGDKYVWCISDGKAKAVKVTTGDLSEKGVIILTGLTRGNIVITEGYQKVSEGMEVTAL